MAGTGFYLALRALQKSATVESINDNGSTQTVDLHISAHEKRTQVPVAQQFGINSHAPKDGAVTHVFAIGGDPAHLIALPPSNPIKGRFGGLKEGETILYDSVGQRLHLKDGKFVRLDACEAFQVGFGPDETVLEINPSGVKITGTLEVSKGVNIKGAVTLNDALTVKKDIETQGDVKSQNVSLQTHTHTSSEAGSPTTPPMTSGGST